MGKLTLPALGIALFALGMGPPRYQEKADHDPEGTGKFYLGREIAPVMGYQAAGWLERPEREKEEQPAELLKILDVKPGMAVADLGAGSGYYSFRVAKLVAPGGKVFAVDIQPEMIQLLEKKAKREKVTNVEAVRCTETDPKLAPNSCDLIFMVDVYHELSYPYEVGQKLVAALKPGGRIAFVEYRLEDEKVPIKLVHKMSERQVIREMAAFPEVAHTRTAGSLPWQHVVIFTKKK